MLKLPRGEWAVEKGKRRLRFPPWSTQSSSCRTARIIRTPSSGRRRRAPPAVARASLRDVRGRRSLRVSQDWATRPHGSDEFQLICSEHRVFELGSRLLAVGIALGEQLFSDQ